MNKKRWYVVFGALLLISVNLYPAESGNEPSDEDLELPSIEAVPALKSCLKKKVTFAHECDDHEAIQNERARVMAEIKAAKANTQVQARGVDLKDIAIGIGIGTGMVAGALLRDHVSASKTKAIACVYLSGATALAGPLVINRRKRNVVFAVSLTTLGMAGYFAKQQDNKLNASESQS